MMGVLQIEKPYIAGLIGFPLSHSLSPLIHETAYAYLNLAWSYGLFSCESARDVQRVIAGGRTASFIGMNVTMPYKMLVTGHCDELDASARLCGCVNVITNQNGILVGSNTDAPSLIATLRSGADVSVEGAHVLILGTGGLAHAAAAQLLCEQASRVVIASRQETRAQECCEQIARACRMEQASGGDDPAQHLEAISNERVATMGTHMDIIINATPLGMQADDPSPLPLSCLATHQTIFDATYGACSSALVQTAHAIGATVVEGTTLLIEQAAQTIELWMDAQGMSPRELPRDILRAALDAQRVAMRTCGHDNRRQKEE